MKLEIEKLAPYLPYGLSYVTQSGKVFKSECKDSFEIRIIKGKSPNGNKQYHSLTLGKINRGEFKLILKPLSDFEKVIAKDLMEKFNCSLDIIQEVWKLIQGDINLEDISLKTYLMMCKNHIDFKGLIKEGLAIDINTLKNQ